MSIKNTDTFENNIQNGVQQVNSDESNNKIAKLTRKTLNQRTNGPVNAHLISWPSKAQNIQNLEKYMVKK